MTPKRGEADRQVGRLPGLSRGRARSARIDAGPRRTFGQPLQNIGNKTTYEWIYDWVRDPEALQPRHLHAGSAPDRCAGRRRRDLSRRAEGTGGRRAPRRRPTRQAVDDVLLDYLKSVMPLDEATGDPREVDAHDEAARARPARHRPVRLLQLSRDRRLREHAADRHRAVGRGQQAVVAARLRVRR